MSNPRSAADDIQRTVAALIRTLSYGPPPLTAEERAAAHELVCVLRDEMAADWKLTDRLESRLTALRRRL
jgi:hypothetical protein